MSQSERRGAPESRVTGDDSPWLTTALAAARARVHPNTLAKWLAAGLPHVRLGDVIRIHRDDLDDWMRAATVTGRGGTDHDEARTSAAVPATREATGPHPLPSWNEATRPHPMLYEDTLSPTLSPDTELEEPPVVTRCRYCKGTYVEAAWAMGEPMPRYCRGCGRTEQA